MPVVLIKINTSSPQLSNPAFKTVKSDLLDTEERKYMAMLPFPALISLTDELNQSVI